MKGMSKVYSTYNTYNPYPFTNYMTLPVFNSDNMYNAYRAYPCPYFFNAPNCDPELFHQNRSENPALADYEHYGSKYNLSRASKEDGSVELRDYGPAPFWVNINEATKQNNTFRTALWTGTHLQLTLMSINVGEDIGLEIHPDLDQFLRIEEGEGIVKMGSSRYNLNFQRNVADDFAFIIPAGTWHNLINTGNKPLKLYSIYAPPQHPKGTVHLTKADAEAGEAHDHQ